MVTVSVLAFQRYMVIVKDRKFPLHNWNITILMLVFIWTYTFLLSFPPLLGLGWGAFHQSPLRVK